TLSQENLSFICTVVQNSTGWPAFAGHDNRDFNWVPTLDRFSVQRGAPVRAAFFQHALAAEDELFVGERFDRFEGETVRSMLAPRRLQRWRVLPALAQREGHAIPDRRQLRR